MVANPQILQKKTKTQYTRLPIHQVKQKLKLETKKPNLKRRERKKKKSSLVINDQRTEPPPQTQATELISHRQLDWKSVIDHSQSDRRFLPRQSPRRAARVSTVPPLSLRPPCSLNLMVFHLYFTLFFSWTLSFSLMGFLSYFSLSLSLSLSLFYLKIESLKVK